MSETESKRGMCEEDSNKLIIVARMKAYMEIPVGFLEVDTLFSISGTFAKPGRLHKLGVDA